MEPFMVSLTAIKPQRPSVLVGRVTAGSESVLGARYNTTAAQHSGLGCLVVVQAMNNQANAWQQKLEKLIKLEQGWDSYDADPPSSLAVNNARGFLSHLISHRQEPTRLAPSVVGGVGITRRQGDRKVYVEFYNDGGILALFSDGVSEPDVKLVTVGYQQFNGLLAEMRAYLDG